MLNARGWSLLSLFSVNDLSILRSALKFHGYLCPLYVPIVPEPPLSVGVAALVYGLPDTAVVIMFIPVFEKKSSPNHSGPLYNLPSSNL